jgi:hypothetical protein
MIHMMVDAGLKRLVHMANPVHQTYDRSWLHLPSGESGPASATISIGLYQRWRQEHIGLEELWLQA